MLKKILKGYKAFTLIELVMVIVILGILAAVAIPKYVGLQGNAREAQEKGVVGGVRGGISIFHANALVGGAAEADEWPDVLEGVALGTTNLFASVLDTPINSGWEKTGEFEYTANKDKTGTVGAEAIYTYDPLDGSFTTTP